ncbi:MAG: GlxA family transcriptional regulator [Alphaproteobacteria bacterium]|nr:GlxA family transcriptional regulator [Alphaproteobacteria bacterium SS10]
MTNEDFAAEIGLLIYPDCQLSAVHGLTDLFRIAGDWAEGGRQVVRVTHWQGQDEGLPNCIWDSHPGSAHKLDYVITPPSIVMPERMQPMPQEAAWLNAQHQSGSRVCSICAGAFVLAESGLLQGRRVTTHWAFAKELAERHGDIDVADRDLVLDDGDIISAGGILAWTDLGLTLVERFFGRSTMLSTARFLVIQPPRATQLPYTDFIPNFDHGDAAILRVQHHIHADLQVPLKSDALSEIAGLGLRTFMRRFAKATTLNPNLYVQQARIAKARSILELTDHPVDQISWEVGYKDPSAFSKTFQRLSGMSASEYRKNFGAMRG